MATPKVLLKRSSLAGRIPDSSDLSYGELAINFADGKLYYKDDANNIKAFVDSARVQAIANAVETTAQSQLDSSEVTALIDSAYVQVRIPESYLSTIIDAAYVQARQDFAYGSLTGAPNILDSADVTNIVDSAYIQLRQSAVGEAGVDSAGVVTIIGATVDSTYVATRQDKAYSSLTGTPTIPTFGTDYIDSAAASAIIVADVTKSFVDALGTNADTLDGFEGVHYLQYSNLVGAPVIDSAYVRDRVPTNQELRTTSTVEFGGMTISGDFNVTGTTTSVNTIVYTTNDPLIHLADSNEQSDLVDIGHIGHYYRNGQRRHTGVFRDASNEEYYIFNNMVDSAFDSVLPPNVINRSATDFQLSTLNVGTLHGVYAGFDSDFNAKSTTNLSEGTNLYYTKARADSDIAASLNDSTNTVSITINNTITDQVDSAYVLARVAEAPFLDSTTATQLIDSAYVQVRQDFAYSSLTGAPTTVSTFTNDAGYLTTTTTTALVDSAYVQLRTLDGDKSLNGLKALQFIHDSDAATYTVTVASKDASHRYQGTGSSSGYKVDGTFSPTIVMNPGNTYRFDLSDATNGSHPLYFYYDAAKTTQYTTNVVDNYSSNAAGSAGSYIEITVTDTTPSVLHYQCGNHGYMGNMIYTQTRNLTGFDTDDLSEGSTNQYYTTTRANSAIDARVTKTFVDNLGVDYTSLSSKPTLVDSAEVIKLITANAIDSGVALSLLLDSIETIALIDSAYVQARQSGGEITIQEEGSSLSTAATTLNFVGSAVTASGTGTTKTITISQAEGGTDSAQVVSIIGATVDSAYVQARQTDGTDSAAIIQLIDSDYVQARQSGGGGTSNVGAYIQTGYRFIADSGQTAFTGSDQNGLTLNYTTDQIDVFLNGVLLVDSADYTQTSSSTVTLLSSTDSADEVSIVWRRGTLVTPNAKTYEYTATGGQSTFSGADANGETLAYSAGAVQVFKQGLLLKSGTDYTATNGTSVVLTSGATNLDKIAISAFAAPAAKATSFNFTADSGQTIFNGNDNSGTSLSYEPENSLVFLNGISLQDSDFTASNGTSVVLATAANLNDELKVVSFGAVTTTQSSNNWSEATASIKISPNEKRFVDVSSAAVTLEIQDSGSNVSMGDELRIIDGYGNAASNNITLRSTKKIIASDSDLIIDINRSGVNLVYYNESNGWVLIEN